MTAPQFPTISAMDLDQVAAFEGVVVVPVSGDGKMSRATRQVNRLAKGALARVVESDAFAKLEDGKVLDIGFPAGLAGSALYVVRLPNRADADLMRRAGGAIAEKAGDKPVLVAAGVLKNPAELALGLCLRSYAFTAYKKDATTPGERLVMVNKPEDFEADFQTARAICEGVIFTRDLVNEPANTLTTTEFANRLDALKEVGLEVEILDEPKLEELGMRALLAVGQGSAAPSKVVVMKWNGGGKEPPLALVGKGVVFDTGGISLKPAAGMEDMTMDMGGASTVAGVMKAIALRKAKANVVGLVGLVENMPDGLAQRPGDIVKSMKGDSVEVINTDAEGRLVLCDVMWYAQQEFAPKAMIDLATLTGAIIIALGHEKAGVFSNDDKFVRDLLDAAGEEAEGAWHMPLAPAYDKQLKSNFADMKNVGGRPAGSITAAQFLQRFVKDDVPWIHLDIAGVASRKTASPLAAKGATGWGVMTLNRLIADKFES